MLTTNVFAVAVGPYVDLSKGSGEFEWDGASNTFDIDASSAAVGFVLDTAPTNEGVFNYRLNVGVARQDLDFDVFSVGTTYELTGLAIENVFGFALVREPGLRWWVGPLIDVGFYGGESEDGSTDVGVFELGIGAATGMNFRAGSNVIIAPSIGFRLTGAAGNAERAGVEQDFSAGFTTGFVNLAVLFD
jgi:hypothetical protein